MVLLIAFVMLLQLACLTTLVLKRGGAAQQCVDLDMRITTAGLDVFSVWFAVSSFAAGMIVELVFVIVVIVMLLLSLSLLSLCSLFLLFVVLSLLLLSLLLLLHCHYHCHCCYCHVGIAIVVIVMLLLSLLLLSCHTLMIIALLPMSLL